TMSCPTALRLCYAFGSNIDVARCGWEIRIESNGKEMFRYAQHDKIPCVIASECNERGNQRFLFVQYR
ncbi:MAG: hypothetical protein K2N54_04995, partial [Helicobacter sp.]|nr:hypothetical protein [Helicobacter sp.]